MNKCYVGFLLLVLFLFLIGCAAAPGGAKSIETIPSENLQYEDQSSEHSEKQTGAHDNTSTNLGSESESAIPSGSGRELNSPGLTFSTPEYIKTLLLDDIQVSRVKYSRNQPALCGQPQYIIIIDIMEERRVNLPPNYYLIVTVFSNQSSLTFGNNISLNIDGRNYPLNREVNPFIHRIEGFSSYANQYSGWGNISASLSGEQVNSILNSGSITVDIKINSSNLEAKLTPHNIKIIKQIINS